MSAPVKIGYKLESLEADLITICEDMNTIGFEPDLIVGIQRGGLVPAVMLSHKLGIPMQILEWQTRDGQTQDTRKLLDLAASGKNILFIDDISDSGLTMKEIKSIMNEYSSKGTYSKYCTLIHNRGCDDVFVPDFTAFLLDKREKNVWIDFFWETL